MEALDRDRVAQGKTSIYALTAEETTERAKQIKSGSAPDKIAIPENYDTCRWSYIRQSVSFPLLNDTVFPWLRSLEQRVGPAQNGNTSLGRISGRLSDAYFILDVNKTDTLKRSVGLIDELRLEWDGAPHDVLPDWPSGQQHNFSSLFHGYDNDRTMVRIAWMNLILHDLESPEVHQLDSLSKRLKDDESGTYDYILANPPFTGSVDEGDLSENRERFPRSGKGAAPLTTKSELLFVWLMLDLLKIGGRAAVIVPDGVLFGGTNAHRALRRQLLFENTLEAVVSLPANMFQPYSGVKTSILLFQKAGTAVAKGEEPRTREVWFYEITDEAFSLDQKRKALYGQDNDFCDALVKFDAWNRYRQGETASKAAAVAKDYHQPDYWEERWRSVDDDFLKTFPDKSGDKGRTWPLHELWPQDFPFDPADQRGSRQYDDAVLTRVRPQFEQAVSTLVEATVQHAYATAKTPDAEKALASAVKAAKAVATQLTTSEEGEPQRVPTLLSWIVPVRQWAQLESWGKDFFDHFVIGQDHDFQPLYKLAQVVSGVAIGRKTKGMTAAVPSLRVANVQAGSVPEGTKAFSALTQSLSAHAFSGQLTADWRDAHAEKLALEAQERDAALKQAGATFTRSRRGMIQEAESTFEQRTDGIYSDLNREQRKLLSIIQQPVGGGDFARYFSAQSLSQSLDGPLRRNPQAIEGHLVVFAARGLIIPVSREEQTEDTGEFVFGNTYRLPFKDRSMRLTDEAGNSLTTKSGEALETERVVGEHSRGPELERLVAQLQKERALP